MRLELALSAIVMCASCGNKPSDRDVNASRADWLGAPVALTSVDVMVPARGRAVFVGTVDAPADATVQTRRSIAHVTTPDRGFAIAIDRAHGSLADRKRVIRNNRHNRFVQYFVDHPNALLYASKRDGIIEYHTLVHITVDDWTYECQNRKRARYTRAQAHTMFIACQTLSGSLRLRSPTHTDNNE